MGPRIEGSYKAGIYVMGLNEVYIGLFFRGAHLRTIPLGSHEAVLAWLSPKP